MQITGEQVIGNSRSKAGDKTFKGYNPTLAAQLEPSFYEATASEIDKAVQLAQAAFSAYRKKTPAEKAGFLDAIGEEIVALGDVLIKRAMEETALPEARLVGERGRTVGQLKLFADMVREGSWVDARIDTAIPDRQPLPKSDIRQIQYPLGVVGVFGASNFPLAFSVAGGDTTSALAAGCPVVFKGHPAHPGTSELVALAIAAAARRTGMPEGVFSLVHGSSIAVGEELVKHPLIKAIGFTGSFRGGKAIFDLANQRPEPIPVYAEMGSNNPVFVLPGALKERSKGIATGFATSLNMGVGQFCTNPGMVALIDDEAGKEFLGNVKDAVAATTAGVMLTEGIKKAYDKGVSAISSTSGVSVVTEGTASANQNAATPIVLDASVDTFKASAVLSEEVFGPASLVVRCDDKNEVLEFARSLHGNLTATLQGTEADLIEYQDLIEILESKVGRLLVNGFPTGVEVCHSMHHGGPYPSTSDSRSTSVGSAAIKRFVRPVCYQDFPQSVLPTELKNENPLGILRLVNGKYTRDAIA